MKKFLIALLLMMPMMAWAEKPNPADYTVKVQVQHSRIALDCDKVSSGSSICAWQQHLTVLIDGKKIELMGPTTSKKIYTLPGPMNVLRAGEYAAKVAKDNNDHTYEYTMSYEFLFADGETRKYQVVGESQ